jgi:hypothetical protein
MPLSRLENFLKNAEGNILYVSPSDFDATDSFENQGNSLTRPFKTIQRALIEAARFSFQQGRNNDKIDRTTILVYPGTHYIDNRPGLSVENVNGVAVYKRRNANGVWVEDTLAELSEFTNYDILDSGNELYKFNSVHGGPILPRGTSIIGLDLRKTKIRPLYVPDPQDDNIEPTSIFNVTGTCYFTAFSIFDGDPTKTVYKNYSNTRVLPNYSHHKVTTFTYADGVNKVKLGNTQTYLTDLDMYYYKVTKAYGDITGRNLPDFPVSLDFEPNVDEFRIVGSLDPNPLGISSIRAGNGDGTGDLNVITVTTTNKQTGETAPHNLFVDSPFIVTGVSVDSDSYNGSFTVKEIVGLTTFTYTTNETPTDFLPSVSSIDTASLTVGSDTVSSASPYIFNCSLRSVYGMNGLWADGAKATGFKSMVVAQFTGVSLQKDDNAFIIFKDGAFFDNASLPINSIERPLHTNSRSIFKPTWENFHIRASNDAFIQNVSVFAIGFARHFLTESGSDMSITNSNSNFGATSLESEGYKVESFDRDDSGYITHIIPPREIVEETSVLSWLSLDVEKIVNTDDIGKLYIFGATNQELIPAYQIDGFRLGASKGDKLNLAITVGIAQTNYTSPILMPVSTGEGASAAKEYEVNRTDNTNDIISNLFSLTTTHQLINGEKVRLFSDTGEVPNGLENEGVYYAITDGFGSSQLKLAQSLNDASSGIPIIGINNTGGRLKIVSRVSDKLPGEIGHPIQWDPVANNWYITGSRVPSQNQIYTAIVGAGVSAIGKETSTCFATRSSDNRSIIDKIYRIRYVIPKEYRNARQPTPGFILQESKTVGVTSISFTNDPISDSKDLKNEKIIVNATSSPIINNQQTITVTTEVPHNFYVGDNVKIQKVRSTNNPLSVGITSTYNGLYKIKSILNSKQFTYSISGVTTNPGNFTNDINSRTTRQQRESLPVVSRESYANTFIVYRSAQIKKQIPGPEGQDGVYHLVAVASNVSPSPQVGFNLSEKKFNQDVRNLYPQLDRDNIESDPIAAVSYADLSVIGKVVTNDKRNSITKEAISYFAKNTRIGIALTDVLIDGQTITVRTEVEHGLNSIKSFTFTAGSGYPASSTLYSKALQPLLSSGSGATVKIQTDPSGQITDVELIDPGSSYSVNDTLLIPGGSSVSVLTVTSISNAIESSVELSGFFQKELNDVYKVVSITNSKDITLFTGKNLPTYIKNTNNENPFLIVSSGPIFITNAELTDLEVGAGIATITTSSAHGLLPGNKVKIVGTGSTILDGYVVVKDTVGLTTFTFSSRAPVSVTGITTGSVLKRGFSSNGRTLGSGEENLFSRGLYLYDGLEANIQSEIDLTSTTITFADPNGIKRGDYFVINSEIIRISGSSNPFTVLRGQLATLKGTAVPGSLAKRIKVLPSELRRPSFMRASGHTFEYLGYGPGNYSTGFPQKQDRVLSEDEILVSQAKRRKGGTVIYNGLNDIGEFYSGATKLSSATGEQTVIDAPIITFTGDDAQGQGGSTSSGIFDDLLVRQRITVEGGEGNNQTSQFYGPVNFTQKVTNLSEFGIETKNLFLKGSAPQAKLLTVGIATPTSLTVPSSRAGDISFLSNPTDFVGYVRIGTDWKPFGLISKDTQSLNIGVDKLSVNTPENTEFDFVVSGDSRVENLIVDGNVLFTQPQTLGNVTFQSIFVNRTGYFYGTGLDPVTGVTTNYTQIHLTGISRLNNLEVVGISTFDGVVNFKSNIFGPGADFGNIQIGITDDNTIDTTTGNLTINSSSGITNIIDNLVVNGDKFELISGTPVSIGGTISASINNARDLRLGEGSTTLGSSLSFHNDDRVYPDGALKIIRPAGIGSAVESEILHRGSGILKITARDFGSRISLLTDNKERILVGASGTITTFQNNSGQNLAGSHLRLNQSGPGDVVISWDITHNNSNRRWYAGIDTSDGYSWKLANPLTTIAYGNENFDGVGETKLKVDTSGSVTILNDFTMFGDSIDAPGVQVFSLLNSVNPTINAFNAARNVTIASDSDQSTTIIRGTTESNTTGSGALVVRGGLGVAKRLFVGGNASVGGDLSIGGDDLTSTSSTFNLLNNSVFTLNAFGEAQNIVLGATTGTTRIRNNVDIDGDLNIDGSNLTTTSSIFRLANTQATSVQAFGAATDIIIGALTGTTRIRNALDINAVLGSTTGNLRIRNPVDIDGDLNVDGSNLTTTSSIFNLINTTATTVNAFGAATNIVLGATTGTTRIRNNVDIDGGTIDNTTIGATTRASARFTSIDVNAPSTFNGTTVSNVILKNYGESVQALGNVSGSVTLDLSIANVFTANIVSTTSFNIANPITGPGKASSFTLYLRNGSSNLSVSWPGNFIFPVGAPNRTLDAGRTDIWIFTSPDGGNTWYGNVALYNFIT